jgi:hypothetical protein
MPNVYKPNKKSDKQIIGDTIKLKKKYKLINENIYKKNIKKKRNHKNKKHKHQEQKINKYQEQKINEYQNRERNLLVEPFQIKRRDTDGYTGSSYKYSSNTLDSKVPFSNTKTTTTTTNNLIYKHYGGDEIEIQNTDETKNKKQKDFSELNGFEPLYEPDVWNEEPSIKKTHNCYAYMLNKINKFFKSKPQPGYSKGYPHMTDNELKKCSCLLERVQADIPDFHMTSFEKKCPAGYSKGYAAIDTSNNPDYHFYRLNPDGTWSHKPGATSVQLKDYNGKIIIQPDKAYRKSDSHFYDQSCGYFCFKSQSGNISDKPIKKKTNIT